jgi:EF-P beta-lysylation protein EpmB
MYDSWQQALKDAIRDPVELCRVLKLNCESQAVRAARKFPLLAPRGFVARMRPGDRADPLLKQVLPLIEEDAEVAGYTFDPLQEGAALGAPGLLQKYAGRALMVTTGACAVHCRYCFRRHFPYQETSALAAGWEQAIDRIAADDSIEEVLLSGGDPLMLVDETLSELAHRLATIGHLRRLRVHTRLPIVVPERVCRSLLNWLCGTRLRPIMVVHANHPAEIDEPVAEALGRLREASVPLLNQSVLLKGVNDDAEVLIELSRRLVDLGVMPYYLHQLDRVAGAAHFAVSEDAGRQMIGRLRAALPGYAVPRYVRERPGAASKLPLEFG